MNVCICWEIGSFWGHSRCSGYPYIYIYMHCLSVYIKNLVHLRGYLEGASDWFSERRGIEYSQHGLITLIRSLLCSLLFYIKFCLPIKIISFPSIYRNLHQIFNCNFSFFLQWGSCIKQIQTFSWEEK